MTKTLAQRSDTRLGVLLMILASLIFAAQDGLSRHLAENYNVFIVVMIRYWFFAAFVVAIAARRPGGIRAAAATSQPWLQAFRGALLAFEICVIVVAFLTLGLVETHAVFACYPLLVAALSGPVLGEQVGWRRWSAIGVGFFGILVILEPGSGAISAASIIPFAGALMFALYGLLTRYAARRDSGETSFFWTGVVGAVVLTAAGIWFWEPLLPRDWIFMGTLCLTGVLGHWLLIKVYDVAEASAVQPFAYFQLPFAATIGMVFFNENLRPNVAIGAAIIVAAGLFTLARERRLSGRLSGRRGPG